MPNKERDEEQQAPVVGKKPTRDDLAKAAEAARDAASAAAGAADTILTALEGETVAQSPLPAGQGMADDRTGARPRTPTGPGAEKTGHGMMLGRIQAHEGPAAFEQFMAALKDPLKKAGSKVRVSDNAGWIKIEGMQGHKVYIAKTKTGVSRVESTLDPDLIDGASAPDRHNGRIASWLPPTPEAVGEAIGLLATLKEPIRPPARGVTRAQDEYDDDREGSR